MRLRVATGVPLSAAAPLDGQEATVIKRLIELLQAVAAPGSRGPPVTGNDTKAVNEQTPVPSAPEPLATQRE
jgi:hypothetical protein